MTVGQFDLGALQRAWSEARHELESDLDEVGKTAAQAGIDASKENHPYADRTGDLTAHAHVEPDPRGGGIMVWSEDYASFVDEGTSRSNPYPFTPLALQVADRDLEYGAKHALDRFKAKLSR